MRVVASSQFPSSRVFPAAILIDASGDQFNIGDGGWVLRNGARTTGHASQLFRSPGGTIFARSPDPLKFFHWYKWIGINSWVDVGAVDPETPLPVPSTISIVGLLPTPSDWVSIRATPGA